MLDLDAAAEDQVLFVLVHLLAAALHNHISLGVVYLQFDLPVLKSALRAAHGLKLKFISLIIAGRQVDGEHVVWRRRLQLRALVHRGLRSWRTRRNVCFGIIRLRVWHAIDFTVEVHLHFHVSGGAVARARALRS